MVISKDGKRKRKEIQPLETVELPKRTKVHAQRKFAQGQGSASSSSFPVTSLIPSIPIQPQPVTPIKAPSPPTELITTNNKRPPHTEDFLTYLCFRGTPILPPHLDYFNSNTNNNRGIELSSSSTVTTTTTTLINNDKINLLSNTSTTTSIILPSDEKGKSDNVSGKHEKMEIVTATTTTTAASTTNNDKNESTNFIPFGVRKRAEQIPDRKHREKVQALRKKYHEQRMAKLRTKRFSKNRSSIQTRSNPIPKAVSPDVSPPSSPHHPTIVDSKRKKEIEKDETIRITQQNKRKIGLRSGLIISNVETQKTLKQVKSEKLSDEKMKETKVSIKKEVASKKESKEQKNKLEEKEKDESVLTLRNKKIIQSKTIPNKDSEVPRMTRQTKIRNPTKDESIKIESHIESEDFSSDDDAPLAAIKKIKTKDEVKMTRSKKVLNVEKNVQTLHIKTEVQRSPTIKSRRQTSLTRMNTRFSDVIPQRSNSRSQTSDVSSKISDVDVKKKIIPIKKLAPTKKQEVPKKSTDILQSKASKIKIERDYSSSNKSDIESPSITPQKPLPPKKVGRKKKINSEAEKPDVHSHIPTATTIINDISETEMRQARPTRKTKEAATIYMELIGRKLNLKETDFDDDAMSLDSFPELPNVRKTEQMENEMKSNYNKDKNKMKLIQKQAKVKKVSVKVKKEDSIQLEEIDEQEVIAATEEPEIIVKKLIKKKESKNLKQTELESESDYEIGDIIKERVKKKLILDETVNKNNKEKKKKDETKLEKSFSESDEEPLASKVLKKRKLPTKQQQKNSSLNVVTTTTTDTIAITTTTNSLEIPESKNIVKIEFPTPVTIVKQSPPTIEARNFHQKPEISKSLIEKFKEQNLGNLTRGIQQQQQQQQQNVKDDQISIKVNRSSEFNSKSFDTNSTNKLNRSGNEIENLIKHQKQQQQIDETKNNSTLKNNDSIFIKQIKQAAMNSMRDLMNPLPSQEESGKIFGIASVSLAQSSGPLDTKCTLGKCGSIHKPPLGPVVPTEAILGEHLTSKERRRAKVNMTHEQIQKWLVESSCTPDPNDMHDDFMDDDFDLKTPPKPISYLSSPSPSPSPYRPDEPSTSSTFRVAKTKQEKIFLNNKEKSSSSVTKGPTLKAKPILVKEEKREESIDRNPVQERNKLDNKIGKYERQSGKTTENKIKEKVLPSSSSSSFIPKIDVKIKEEVISLLDSSDQKSVKEERSSVASVTTSIKPPASITEIKTTPKTGTTKTKSNSSAQKLGTTITTDRKLIFNQRRLPVYNAKLQETPKIKQIVKNTFGAFSPDNETSVYSFDKEDDVIPVATPFRRHDSRRESNNSRQDDSLERLPTTQTPTTNQPTTTTNAMKKANEQITPIKNNLQPEVSLTLSPDDNTKSASIVVQTFLDEIPATVENCKKQIINNNISCDKQDDNSNNHINNDCLNDSNSSDGQTFYIPLQGTNIIGNKSEQIIQGVAVKLGTEGPDGPNQRVIMHAKLVTKTQMGTTTTTTTSTAATGGNGNQLIDTLGNNVQELVKSLIGNNSKEQLGSKSVPVGTVQPRFKSSDSIIEQLRSLSPQQSTSEQLPRVNSNSSITSQNSKIQKLTTITTTSSSSAIKIKNDFPLQQTNNTTFPRHDDPAQMVDAPIFKPTEKEFQDPLEYIERISSVASRFGVCKIIPPNSFKPECRLSDDMRFTAYNQYVHKMLQRWGPSTKELSAIKKYLATQSITLTHPPWIGGMEVDLPRLYHTVQELGGLSEVIEKKKWVRVAEEMCIPKTAHDRVTKLDDIYCKYLLPYDTLSPNERQKLFDEVEADWAKRETKARHNSDRCANNETNSNSDDDDDDDEDDESDNSDGDTMECIVKGRSMPLSAFFRIARNTMSLWFKNSEPTINEIETEFWRHVAVRDSHVCVHSGSIDSSGWGYGFPTPGPKTKNSPCSKHPWNLKVLTNNIGSILRSLGPVMGVTVPTLQFGMLFSGCCWYRDPHGLPWIEYLHTGASKIWYGVPDDQSANLRSAVMTLVPTHCQNKTIWLPSDTAMVPPHMLTERGVSLCRTEQQPGQFIVVFPRAYTSSVCTGYLVSESVYFGTNSWLESAKQDFKDIQESGEPPVFSLEQLLFAISSDQRSNLETLEQILPMVTEMYEKEVSSRKLLKAAGVTSIEKLVIQKSSRKVQTEVNECNICRANLYISMVKIDDDTIYCLHHTIKYLNNLRIKTNQCKLIYSYGTDEIEQMLENLRERIAIQKKKLYNKKNQMQQQKGGQQQQNKLINHNLNG